jgi:hypothetical protein
MVSSTSSADADVRMEDDVLTLDDLECWQNKRPLVKYDAMIVYGEEDEDADFAAHLRDRMEMAGLKVRKEI